MGGTTSNKAVSLPPQDGVALAAAGSTKAVVGQSIDALVIDLNLRLLSGRAERLALEASCEQAGVLVDEAGNVTRLRLP